MKTENSQILMWNIFFVFLFSPFISCCAQDKNPFLTLKYDKVILVDFEPTDKGGLIVGKDGRFLPKVTKKVVLDAFTIRLVNTRLGANQSYGAGTAACFNPHCGFVYYLNNQVVAQISICLGCNRLSSSVDIPARHQGKQGKGKEVYYLADGLSKSFRAFINTLLIKYNFSHQATGDSAFD